MLCCGYTLTDFPISIRLTSLALWQSNDCPSASKATLMNMDKYFIWIHYERLHNHNKAKNNKTVCIFIGLYCSCREIPHNFFRESNYLSCPNPDASLIIVKHCYTRKCIRKFRQRNDGHFVCLGVFNRKRLAQLIDLDTTVIATVALYCGLHLYQITLQTGVECNYGIPEIPVRTLYCEYYTWYRTTQSI